MIFFVVIPVQICFEESLTMIKTEHYSELLKYFCIIVFSMDIIISFNLGFFDNGLIVLNRKTIIKRYFNKLFLSDLLALTSVYFYFTDDWSDLHK